MENNQPVQMYYFVLQMKSSFGEDWYLSSSMPWEKTEEYLFCVSNHENVVAVTKIKEEDFHKEKNIDV